MSAMVDGHKYYFLSPKLVAEIYKLPTNDFFVDALCRFLSEYRQHSLEAGYWDKIDKINPIRPDTCCINVSQYCNTRSAVKKAVSETYSFFAPIAVFCDNLKNDLADEIITDEWRERINKELSN
jgi:hypothetical protein